MAKHRNRSAGYPAKPGNQKPAIVNDFLPGDPGSSARRLPAMQAPAEESLPYRGNLEIVAASVADPPVTLPASVVRRLVLASDVLREHVKTVIRDTPAIVGLETLDVMAGAGLVDRETHEPTEAFEVALAIAGQAVGIGRGAEVGASPADRYFADVEAAERMIVAGATLPAAGSFVETVTLPAAGSFVETVTLPAAGSFSAG